MSEQKIVVSNSSVEIDPKVKEVLTKELTNINYAKTTVNDLKKYIEKGISTETKDSCNETPLIKAILADNMAVTEYLVSQSADMYATNLSGQTSMMLCAKKGWMETAKKMFEKGYDINREVPSTHQSVLTVAIWNHQLDMVKWLLQNGSDVNRLDNLKWTPLMIASYVGSVDIVQELLKYHADISQKNNRGMTALDLATFYKHEKIVKILSDNVK